MTAHQPPPPEPQRRARTTILDLEENLLLEILLRLPSLPSLVLAALACRPFLTAVRACPAFRRLFRERHPHPLLGFFFDSNGGDAPSFTPLRRRADPGLAAAVRGADFFITRLPCHDGASRGWDVEECRGGRLILANRGADQLAVYNPLTGSLRLLPMPSSCEFSDGRRRIFRCASFFLLSSEDSPWSFRVVSVGHDRSRTRAAVFSSATAQWQILPWSEPYPAQLVRRQALASQGHAGGRQPLLGTQESTLPGGSAYRHAPILHHRSARDPEGARRVYMTGETKDGELCIVSVAEFTLLVWRRRANGDNGVEKWRIHDVIPLDTEILGATEISGDPYTELKLKVWAVLDGVVYMNLKPRSATLPSWFLSFCLETRKMEKLVKRTFDSCVHAYIMAWPPFLVGNLES
ncbi:hypothetical protein ACP4OV_019325 [Aristida adscensionis]